MKIYASDQLDAIERHTLEALASDSDPDLQLKRFQILHAIQELRDAPLNAEKVALDLTNARRDLPLQKTRFWATTLTPILAITITAVTFVVTTRNQNAQFKQTAEAQSKASESSQWRDAVKSLSVKDSSSSLTAAFAMQGFFDYEPQARKIASALLPRLTDVKAFDEILADMAGRTTTKVEEADLIGVGQAISFAQRERFNISGAVPPSGEKSQFLKHDVFSIDTISNPGPTDITTIAAWELDSVSHRLAGIWKREDRHDHDLWPTGINLDAVVLEDACSDHLNFDGVSFDGSTLRVAVLLDASFKQTSFRKVDLSDTLLKNINLKDANLSGITKFQGSVWIDTNWWEARCIAPDLLTYLVKQTKHTLTDEEQRSKNCQ